MTRTRMRNGLLLSLALLSTGAFANVPTGEAELAKLSASAKTATEHAAVARGYRELAAQRAQQAAAHEAQVNRLRREPPDPLRMKWRHALPDPVAKEQDRAQKARLAAQEAQGLAARHSQLAVEVALVERRDLGTAAP